MAEATVPTSLAIRARQLAALSRAKSDDERETQDQTQVESALGKLNTELGKLDTVLKLHHKLAEVGVPVEPLKDLDKPAKKLRDQIETIGRPTLQFLTARNRDVVKACSEIEAGDRAAWRGWAEESIAQLPDGLIPRLGPADRPYVTSRISDLKKTAVSPKLNSGDVAVFVTTLQSVRDRLGDVEESHLDAVLAKFENRRVRLADLTDDELRMLRDDGTLADQLYLELSS
ncbi:hypothetical protein BOO86_23905 [Mycobacterium sp. CBMA 234]|uniref:hypothetical protein n=1 Tax=Mycolicibacterium sp. CBMA 234 TaxID=1918495 RepID=UPI0012DE33D5|nr:hypothetical protein [Mycolicibacterium sp. CBMA 234]MUL67537.1 hypothetical protein [Mycolicibacterium sp. CBMA 234]